MEGKGALLAVLRQLQGKERMETDNMVYSWLGIILSKLPISLVPTVFWVLLSLLLHSPQNTVNNIEERSYRCDRDCLVRERQYVADPDIMPLLLT